jgi:hypothetical protein
VVGAALFLGLGLRARWFDHKLVAGCRAEALWISGAVAIAALVYMAKIATEAAPRVVAPYYPLVIAGVLVVAAVDGRVVHRRFWQWAGLLVMLSAVPMLVLSPSRPLFPVQAVSGLIASHGASGSPARFEAVYKIYASRAFAFQEVTALIPPGQRAVGFLQNGDVPEVSLWRPFGSRKVIEVTAGDSAAEIRAQGIHLLMVSEDALEWNAHTDINHLLAKWSAHLVAQKEIPLKAQQVGSDTWYVISLD